VLDEMRRLEIMSSSLVELRDLSHVAIEDCYVLVDTIDWKLVMLIIADYLFKRP
jgi:hypothetical protein